jgi:glycosyltransferase involved in cell wall biosynthesis
MSRPREARKGWRSAHVVAAPIDGGVTAHVIDAARFDPRGPLPIVLPPWPGLDRAARRAAGFGVPVVRAAPPPRPDDVAAWLARRPVDLVHVHYATPFDCTPIVEAALAADIEVVSTDHAHPDCVPHDSAAWDRRRLVVARQAAVLADSEAIAVALQPRLAEDDGNPSGARLTIHVVRHGIDVEHFAAVPERGVARAALGLEPARRVIGVVAALFESKGVHDVLAAAARIEPAPVVVVAGEGPERPRLVQLAATLGVEARLLGWVDDVRPVLAAADVVALASRSEGLPSVVVQAFLALVPVVATDAPGTAEALGRYGIRVPHGRIEALAAGLERALSGGLRAERLAARDHARRFNARFMAQEIALVHTSVLRTRNASRPPERAARASTDVEPDALRER